MLLASCVLCLHLTYYGRGQSRPVGLATPTVDPVLTPATCLSEAQGNKHRVYITGYGCHCNRRFHKHDIVTEQAPYNLRYDSYHRKPQQ